MLVSGAQGLPGTFLVAGKHSKAAMKLKGLGCRTCLAGLGEFSTLGLWGEGNSFWGELTKNGGGSSSLLLLSF